MIPFFTEYANNSRNRTICILQKKKSKPFWAWILVNIVFAYKGQDI